MHRVLAACALAVSTSAGSASSPPLYPSWLFNRTVALLQGCEERSFDGVVIFTPDATSSYGAQWTRDFTMALQNAPDAMAAFGANATAAVAYHLARVTPSGMVPDRVYADGHSVFAPGTTWPITLAWDNMPYAGLMLTALADGWPGVASDDFFCAWEPTVARASAFLALSAEGLAWNAPEAPNSSWGFIDSVTLTQRMLFVSLLHYDSSTRMAAAASRTGCGNASAYAARASAVASSIDLLADPSSPLFLASDGIDALPDVWGSAYLAYLGLSTALRRQGVADWLAAQWAGANSSASVWQAGQLRHLPQPLVWQKCWTGCPRPGTYQNGAFWGTPLRWALPLLARTGHADVAAAALAAAVANFQSEGVMEAVNIPIGYAGVRDYVATAANVLGAEREMAAIADAVAKAGAAAGRA